MAAFRFMAKGERGAICIIPSFNPAPSHGHKGEYTMMISGALGVMMVLALGREAPALLVWRSRPERLDSNTIVAA
jgi:hypothetical protein